MCCVVWGNSKNSALGIRNLLPLLKSLVFIIRVVILGSSLRGWAASPWGSWVPGSSRCLGRPLHRRAGCCTELTGPALLLWRSKDGRGTCVLSREGGKGGGGGSNCKRRCVWVCMCVCVCVCVFVTFKERTEPLAHSNKGEQYSTLTNISKYDMIIFWGFLAQLIEEPLATRIILQPCHSCLVLTNQKPPHLTTPVWSHTCELRNSKHETWDKTWGITAVGLVVSGFTVRIWKLSPLVRIYFVDSDWVHQLICDVTSRNHIKHTSLVPVLVWDWRGTYVHVGYARTLYQCLMDILCAGFVLSE